MIFTRVQILRAFVIWVTSEKARGWWEPQLGSETQTGEHVFWELQGGRITLLLSVSQCLSLALWLSVFLLHTNTHTHTHTHTHTLQLA